MPSRAEGSTTAPGELLAILYMHSLQSPLGSTAYPNPTQLQGLLLGRKLPAFLSTVSASTAYPNPTHFQGLLPGRKLPVFLATVSAQHPATGKR